MIKYLHIHISYVYCTGAALLEYNDASTELTTANGGAARLMSLNVSNALKYANMSENFIHQILTLYLYIIYKKYVKRKLIRFQSVVIARSVTGVL